MSDRTPDPRLATLSALWSAAYQRYFRFWTRLAKATQIPEEEARDIVQTVVVSLLSREDPHFESLEHLRNYVARSVINRCLQMKQRAEKHIEWNDFAESQTRNVAETSATELAEVIRLYREAIRHLSRIDFEIIKYRFYAGLTFAQISELLHLPVSTLKSREAAALKRLRKWLHNRGL